MKNNLLISLVALLFYFEPSFAQAPQGINYQGVARGIDGQPLASKEISIRVSVLKESANGDVEYNEIHEVRTNTFGLFTLVIGQGAAGASPFNFIGWTSGKKWLQIELDENGGRNFKLMGSQQLMSVPYALYAERAGNGYQAGQGIGINNNMITNLGDGDTDPTNELISSVTFGADNKLRITDAGGVKEADLSALVGASQNLGSVLTQGNNAANSTITNLGAPIIGSDAATKTYVDAHTDADASPTNEIQNLSQVLAQGNDGGGTRISNIGSPTTNGDAATKLYVDNLITVDGDKNATNEAQSLSRTGNNITLTQVSGTGGGVVSIDDADANPTNEAQTLSKTGTTVSLTNVGGTGGGSFILNDDSNTNEAQSISLTGNTVTLTAANGAGGGFFSINDADANPTNEAQTISRAGNNVTMTQVSGVGGGTFNIDDADANATNEAQTISRAGSIVTLSTVGVTGGGSFSIDDADADPVNELQNLNQVLTRGNTAGGSNITNLANPISPQDATTKNYVDAADAALLSRISTTYAFKATFDYQNLSGLVVNNQTMPFTDNFDDFNTIGAATFTAAENGIYLFSVEGVYNTSIAGGSLSLLYNSVKYPITIVLPFGATQPRFSGTFTFKLTAGQTVSLVGDNIALLAQFNGIFFGYKL